MDHSRHEYARSVGHFTIKPFGLIVLFSVLFVILMVQALPQVDLLDTAFQGNTAPIVVHARATSHLVLHADLNLSSISSLASGVGVRQVLLALDSDTGQSLPIFHHNLRC